MSDRKVNAQEKVGQPALAFRQGILYTPETMKNGQNVHGGYAAVWRAVARIPNCRVATYGQIAQIIGRPGHARFVGYALHSIPPGLDIPWHRVVNGRGMVSLSGAAGARQIHLLKAEGIRMLRGKIDLNRF